MIVIVKTPFVGTIGGQNFNMPPVDSRLDVTDEIARELLQMGVVARMETKIDRPPLDVKKKSRMESLQAARRPPQRIVKN